MKWSVTTFPDKYKLVSQDHFDDYLKAIGEFNPPVVSILFPFLKGFV